MIDQVVPDYTLLAQIGQGGYGEVYLAKSTTGQYRAVKIVWRKRLGSTEAFDRELRGVNAYESVSRRHESLVDIRHVGRVGSRLFYYVMDAADDARRGREFDPSSYVPRTLRSELAGRAVLSIEECIEVGLALASALIFLQENSLIHRDVKPENIIFIHGQLKLADVGLVADVRNARSLVGTEGYEPPEHHGDYPGDVYSLGKLLYEISTGRDRREFGSAPSEEADSDDPRFAAFNKIVQRAAAQNYKRRYRTAQALHKDLLQLKSKGDRSSGARPKKKLTTRTRVAICLCVGLALTWLLRPIKDHSEQSPPPVASDALDVGLIKTDKNAEPVDLQPAPQPATPAQSHETKPIVPTQPAPQPATAVVAVTAASTSNTGRTTDAKSGDGGTSIRPMISTRLPLVSVPGVTTGPVPARRPDKPQAHKEEAHVPAQSAAFPAATAPLAGDGILASATAEAVRYQASMNALRAFLGQCPPVSLLKARLIDDQGKTLALPKASKNAAGTTKLAMRIEISVDVAEYFTRFEPGLTKVLAGVGRAGKSAVWIDEPDAPWNESNRDLWRREVRLSGDHHFKGEEPRGGPLVLFAPASKAFTPGRLAVKSLELDQDAFDVLKTAGRMPDLHIILIDGAGQVLVDAIVVLADKYGKNMSIVGASTQWAAVLPAFVIIPSVNGELLSTYDRFVVERELTVEDAVLLQTSQFQFMFYPKAP